MSTLRLVNAAQLGVEINVRDVFQYSTLKEMSASANLSNSGTDNDSLKKQPLFEVSKQLVDNKHNPFDALPMQRAYWMGQMFIQAAERDGASNLEEAEGLYSPHVYMEYEVVDTIKELLKFQEIAEKTIEVLLKRHEILHSVMTHDGQMKVLSVNDCHKNGFHKIKVINASAKDVDIHRQNLI